MKKGFSFCARNKCVEHILHELKWYIDKLKFENNIENDDDITIIIPEYLWYCKIKPYLLDNPTFASVSSYMNTKSGKLFGYEFIIDRHFHNLVSDETINIHFIENDTPVWISTGWHNNDWLRSKVIDEVTNTKSSLNVKFGYGGPKEMRTYRTEIKRVIFNDPVTVILWEDGTKTMVRCQGREKYDPEKGFALCVAKRFLGDNENRSNYYDVYKKWAPEDNNKKRGK